MPNMAKEIRGMMSADNGILNATVLARLRESGYTSTTGSIVVACVNARKKLGISNPITLDTPSGGLPNDIAIVTDSNPLPGMISLTAVSTAAELLRSTGSLKLATDVLTTVHNIPSLSEDN